MARPEWGNSIALTDVEAPNIGLLDLGGVPGWALLTSPQANVRWEINGAEGKLDISQFLETGPASGQAVWIGRSGTTVKVRTSQNLFTTETISPIDGSVVIAPPPEFRGPRAKARFFPAAHWRTEKDDKGNVRDRGFPQQHPILQSSSMTRRNVIATQGVATIIGFPPGNRDQLQIRAQGPVIMSIRAGPPAAGFGILFTSAASDSHSLDVSPQHWVTVQAPGPTSRLLQAVWRNVGGIRQV